MRDLIRKMLTKRILSEEPIGRKVKIREEPPSDRLVIGVQFVITSIAALTILQIAHLAFLGTWNNEIFSGITGLIGTVTGIIIGSKT